MFAEDIYTGLMGFRLGGDDGRQVHVEADEAARTGLEAICASPSDHERYDLAETVQSAIESVATRLAWFGEAIYEICGQGTEIALESVVPYRLLHVPGGFMQFVPKRQWHGRRRIAFLPASSAWVVRLPRGLGRPRSHRHLLGELTAASRPTPEFWMRELGAGKLTTPFVFTDYNRIRDAYVARLTRHWGWNRRDSSGTNDTEFFYFFRSLRFRQAQAIVRDHIVDELNGLMKRLGINARVRLQGFRTPAEIEELIKRASAGSLHYAEALKQTR